MRYGINWGLPAITPELRKTFKPRIRIKSDGKLVYAMLDGVCQNLDEQARMIMQASNGKRKFEIVEKAGYRAIYTYWS